jgi:uncharacterized protein
MKRTIENKLVSWKDSTRRKPLIVRGARQVGKTWSIKRFGKEYFDQIVTIDFERKREWHSFFDGNLDPKEILQQIEIATHTKIIPRKTLLFFDEVQSCPRAIMSLRYFYEVMPELHVIVAGSLLDFALNTISFPVGRVQYLQMFPLSFSEFLQATNNMTAVEIINEKPRKLPRGMHKSLLNELKKYFFVGGMPESVEAFIENQSLVDSFDVHTELIYSFKDDFKKYAGNSDTLCLDDVFVNTSRNIGSQLSYSNLSNSFSHPTIKKAFNLLQKAQILKRVSSVSSLQLPLDTHVSSRKFKAIMLDIGIWQQLSGISVEIELAKPDLMNIYRGALSEQFVGQEILATMGHELHYWARNAKSSNAEVDYVVTIGGKVYPIEVKSGAAGSLKSLHLALKSFPDSPGGIVLSTGEYAVLKEKRLVFMPLYYAGNIRESMNNFLF